MAICEGFVPRLRRALGLLVFLFALAAMGCSAALDYPGALGVAAPGAQAAGLHEPQPYEPEAAEAYEAMPPAEPEPPRLRYAVMPDNPRPGYPVTIGVSAGFGVETASLMLGGRRIARGSFFPAYSDDGSQPFKATLLTVPTTIGAGQPVIVLETSEGVAAEIPLAVAARQFHSETIALTPALTGIQTDMSPQRVAESQHLWAVLGRVGTEAYFTGSFVRPVQSTRRTSIFGARRVFVNQDGSRSTSIHAGIDYGIPTGTPVFASGGGRVVLARDRIVSGKSVIIEHLPGVFSIYYHLDAIGVREGDMIETGAVLGLSGNTGFSTGPHLHWEVRVFGENTDPDAIVARPLLDRSAILGIMGY